MAFNQIQVLNAPIYFDEQHQQDATASSSSNQYDSWDSQITVNPAQLINSRFEPMLPTLAPRDSLLKPPAEDDYYLAAFGTQARSIFTSNDEYSPTFVDPKESMLELNYMDTPEPMEEDDEDEEDDENDYEMMDEYDYDDVLFSSSDDFDPDEEKQVKLNNNVVINKREPEPVSVPESIKVEADEEVDLEPEEIKDHVKPRAEAKKSRTSHRNKKQAHNNGPHRCELTINGEECGKIFSLLMI